MSSPIKPGDLVQVIKPAVCCGDTTTLGRIFIVEKEVHYPPLAMMACAFCGVWKSWKDDSLWANAGKVYGAATFFEKSRLKKLDGHLDKYDEEIKEIEHEPST